MKLIFLVKIRMVFDLFFYLSLVCLNSELDLSAQHNIFPPATVNIEAVLFWLCNMITTCFQGYSSSFGIAGIGISF